ncbi:epidermal growth factor receptor kinase substrate 8-like protein 3 [Pterocles gutturalis]
MGEHFGRWSSPPSRSEYDDSSTSFARPSGKSIYNQRKDYSQALLKPQSDFQHHVEHLLTVALEGDIRSPEDCLARLRGLEAQGRVWGQDLILHIQDHELVLRDVESKEELEAYPLSSVLGCTAVLGVCSYDSVLAISVQERSPPKTSVLLFQCERLGAETLRNSLEKVLKQWKKEQRNHYGSRSSLETPPSLTPPYAHSPYAETPPPHPYAPPRRELPSSNHSSLDTPQAPLMSEEDRDVEVLNHVLRDMELFVLRLRTALGSGSSPDLRNKGKKKKKNKGAMPSRDDYVDFFQKVKYALNLLVLGHCPDPQLAPAVVTPLLLPEALELLERTLPPRDHRTWQGLGIAWGRSRAEYPNGDLVPAYIPVFSDGWLPPLLKHIQIGRGPKASVSPTRPIQVPPSLIPPPSPDPGRRDDPGYGVPPPAQGQVRALYEFQGRNPQELSVRRGDMLQVLDERKKWWLVQDGGGQRGYVPSNILEPLGQGVSQVGGPSPVPSLHPRHQEGVAGDTAPSFPCPPPPQASPPNLHPDSSPAEVTAWLKDKGFSQITVRCLGVLRGHQLLQMSPSELRGVCPEEWRRLLFKLSAVRTSLGMDPRV